ncbi:hypothetical protein [Rhodococcus sp. IEGM 1379]|uniref:hypothetical protein n=1 Tax=Rhodococcus sp. IEGM 1379 TaxID=3047086 RepID=UPI0024B6C3AA|nr:hypothetical protein [Rhodococcus sp. IEGM 1379]MDI9915816.1 hypothetical protein [Rhodococcus sp. IEGM 1379]
MSRRQASTVYVDVAPGDDSPGVQSVAREVWLVWVESSTVQFEAVLRRETLI